MRGRRGIQRAYHTSPPWKRAASPFLPPLSSPPALEYGTSAEAYCGYRRGTAGRDVAAMLCRRWTTAALRELSCRFGLSHPDSASDLIRRGKSLADLHRDVAMSVASIEKALGLNPETRVQPCCLFCFEIGVTHGTMRVVTVDVSNERAPAIPERASP
jgi:hypothetical protein